MFLMGLHNSLLHRGGLVFSEAWHRSQTVWSGCFDFSDMLRGTEGRGTMQWHAVSAYVASLLVLGCIAVLPDAANGLLLVSVAKLGC